MTKKITPDPPTAGKTLSTADKDLYLRKVSDAPSSEFEPTPANPLRLLDTLAFTCSKPVTPEAPYKPTLFAIQPGINAQDALTYVSNLLETAELNGDEISLHTNPVERALFWACCIRWKWRERWWMPCLRARLRPISDHRHWIVI